jgi:hypothetical protein
MNAGGTSSVSPGGLVPGNSQFGEGQGPRRLAAIVGDEDLDVNCETRLSRQTTWNRSAIGSQAACWDFQPFVPFFGRVLRMGQSFVKLFGAWVGSAACVTGRETSCEETGLPDELQ